MNNYNSTKKKNRRKELIYLLGLLMIGTASGDMYGYWTDGVTAPEEVSKNDNVVTIGKGKDIRGALIYSKPPSSNRNVSKVKRRNSNRRSFTNCSRSIG